MDKLLLSSGEFSKMCNVSRELLIHYDKTGMLKPKEVHENGYRYYSLEQLYLFDAIRFFVDIGMPTKEVKEYFENRSTEVFLDRIESITARMKEQQSIMELRIEMMERMRYITNRALLFPMGEPMLSFWAELPLVVTAIPDQTERSYAEAISEHSDFCRNVAFTSKYPMGRIAEVPDAARPAEFEYRQLFTWISMPEQTATFEGRLSMKPRGNYAVIMHRGGMSTIAASYEKLFGFIQAEGLGVSSPVYELDMNSCLTSSAEEDFLIHIAVLVGE